MALTLLAANNAQTVLAAGISASATSMTVNSGTGALFPAPSAGVSFFKLTLIDAATGQLTEIVHVTARSGDTMTIDRAQEGTTARAWSANDIAANMMTAGTLSYILSNFQPLDPTLTALAALIGAANKLPYFNGDDTATLTDLSSVGRDIIGKSSIVDVLTYLQLSNSSGFVGRKIGEQWITASSTYAPTAGTKRIKVTITGGGGGGGGAFNSGSASDNFSGAGGAAGATGIKWFNIADITNFAVVIGAGGTEATKGGDSTFSGIVATGGAPSVAATVFASGGTGVAGTGADVNISGGDGGDGQNGTRLLNGIGGASFWGGSRRSGQGSVPTPTIPKAKVYGGGGGGAYDTQTLSTRFYGGSGANGICLIEEFA